MISSKFVLLSMVWLHIVDDFVLQGILAQLKQKSFWKGKGDMYKFDWLVGLFMHSFSWTFMIMLPIAFYHGFFVDAKFLLIFLSNMIMHGVIDNLKCNQFKINLITDQSMHLIQIVIAYTIMI